MKIYKLDRQDYYGGIGDRSETKTIGYYESLDKAIDKAKSINKENDPIALYYKDRKNKYGWNGLWVDLDGNETGCIYSGYIIEKIEVE